MIPAESDYWVRYSEARTNAVVLAVYAALWTVVVVRYVSTTGNAYGFAAGFLGGVVVLTWLIEAARREWGRAKMARASYRAWNMASVTFTTMLATTVLKTLQVVAEGAEKTNNSEAEGQP